MLRCACLQGAPGAVLARQGCPRRPGSPAKQAPAHPAATGSPACGERPQHFLNGFWHRRAIEAASMPAASADMGAAGLTADHGTDRLVDVPKSDRRRAWRIRASALDASPKRRLRRVPRRIVTPPVQRPRRRRHAFVQHEKGTPASRTGRSFASTPATPPGGWSAGHRHAASMARRCQTPFKYDTAVFFSTCRGAACDEAGGGLFRRRTLGRRGAALAH